MYTQIYSLQNEQNQNFDFGGFFKWAHVTWYHSKQELHIILWSCWSASFEQTVQMYKGFFNFLANTFFKQFQPSLVKCLFTKLMSTLISVTTLDTRSAFFQHSPQIFESCLLLLYRQCHLNEPFQDNFLNFLSRFKWKSWHLFYTVA
jgi:hypothetical protein